MAATGNPSAPSPGPAAPGRERQHPRGLQRQATVTGYTGRETPREAQTPGQGLAPHPQPSPQVPSTSTPNHHTHTRLACDPPTNHNPKQHPHHQRKPPHKRQEQASGGSSPSRGHQWACPERHPADAAPGLRNRREGWAAAGPQAAVRAGFLAPFVCAPGQHGATPERTTFGDTNNTPAPASRPAKQHTRFANLPQGEQRRRGTSTASHGGQLPHREPFHTLGKRKPRSGAGAKPTTSSHPAPSDITHNPKSSCPRPCGFDPRANLQPERGSHRDTNTNPAQNRGRVSPVRLSGLLKSRVVVVRGGLPDLRPPLLQGRRCGGRNSVFCWSEKLWGFEVGGLSDPFKVATSLPLQQAADRSPGMLRDACLAAALTGGGHPRP